MLPLDFDGDRISLPDPAEAEGHALANIGHRCRPEACNAGSLGVAHARIDEPKRASAKQLLGKILRFDRAGRAQNGIAFTQSAQIVELAAEIIQESPSGYEPSSKRSSDLLVYHSNGSSGE